MALTFGFENEITDGDLDMDFNRIRNLPTPSADITLIHITLVEVAQERDQKATAEVRVRQAHKDHQEFKEPADYVEN